MGIDLGALSKALAGVVHRAGAAVVAIHGRERVQSSGVVWREGVIVTAEHTVQRDEDVEVALPSGDIVAATLAGRDPGTDLAVLRVEAPGLAPAERVGVAGLAVGHLVVAVARSAEEGLGASSGIVSALSGAWRTWRGGSVEHFLQPDLRLFPGFSGGPLVDVAGRVIGINTSGMSRIMVVTIPAETVDRVVDDLLLRGSVQRGYLGLGMQSVRLPRRLAEALGLEGERGVIVLSVEEDGPADRAGLLVGDVLVALDGRRVGDTDDVVDALSALGVGAETRIALVRAGAAQEFAVTVGQRPHG